MHRPTSRKLEGVRIGNHFEYQQDISPIQPQIYQPASFNDQSDFTKTSSPILSSMPMNVPLPPLAPSYPTHEPNPSILTPFMNPTVQNFALQYGQQLGNTGADYVKQEIEKFIPTSTTLKYYFAVDNKYVVKKLLITLFPFFHKDWSIKYEQQNPVQPKYEINAPDLYIPMMAFITYILVAGLVMGTQARFSPEQLGILSSKVLAWWLIEIAIYTIVLYIMNIETALKTYDLIAYSGYKFIAVIAAILTGLFISRFGYYITLLYCDIALVFFLLRSIKVKILRPSQTIHNQFFENNLGTKRRIYFLLFIALIQPLFSWWFSFEFV